MFIYADEILLNADKEDVAFLVVGDPFGFVLHITLYPVFLYNYICKASRLEGAWNLSLGLSEFL